MAPLRTGQDGTRIAFIHGVLLIACQCISESLDIGWYTRNNVTILLQVILAMATSLASWHFVVFGILILLQGIVGMAPNHAHGETCARYNAHRRQRNARRNVKYKLRVLLDQRTV